jgi:hypothetical protein
MQEETFKQERAVYLLSFHKVNKIFNIVEMELKYMKYSLIICSIWKITNENNGCCVEDNMLLIF